MHRFLHEQSVSYRGKLIIPFIFGKADFQTIYSYALLEEQGHKSELHKAENPAELYLSNIEEIIDIAKRHLDERAEKGSERIFLSVILLIKTISSLFIKRQENVSMTTILPTN